MNTGVFRGGCLAGPRHSGAELHSFLAYLMKCAVTGRPYHIFGYKGTFEQFAAAPRHGEVYNMGGSRFPNCFMMEAIALCDEIGGNKMHTDYTESNRIDDHIWWISDASKFATHYPAWRLTKTIRDILTEIHEYNLPKWKAEG